MFRSLIPALLTAAALSAAPAAALDLEQMSDAERDAFGAAVRSYLLENPEVLMEAIQVLEERDARAMMQAEGLAIQENAAEIFEDGHSWVGGNLEGDVVMVEFIDYRCSFCRRAHPEVKELVETDGGIRRIVKEFPILGQESETASRFAISTLRTEGSEAYALVHDELMTMRGGYTERQLRELAELFALDADAILDGMADPEVTQIIAENRALAQRLSITGTPTFVVGEQFVRGYLPLDGMRSIVAEERRQ